MRSRLCPVCMHAVTSYATTEISIAGAVLSGHVERYGRRVFSRAHVPSTASTRPSTRAATARVAAAGDRNLSLLGVPRAAARLSSALQVTSAPTGCPWRSHTQSEERSKTLSCLHIVILLEVEHPQRARARGARAPQRGCLRFRRAHHAAASTAAAQRRPRRRPGRGRGGAGGSGVARSRGCRCRERAQPLLFERAADRKEPVGSGGGRAHARQAPQRAGCNAARWTEAAAAAETAAGAGEGCALRRGGARGMGCVGSCGGGAGWSMRQHALRRVLRRRRVAGAHGQHRRSSERGLRSAAEAPASWS
eukprot:360919-Chlamydomonas_euryale.AAC.5